MASSSRSTFVTGHVRWKHYTIPNPPTEAGRTRVGTPIIAPSGAPVWNSPTVDHARGRLYFGSGENYSTPADGNSDAVFAVDRATGRRPWTYQATAGDAWNAACMLKGNGNCPRENGPDNDVAAFVLSTDVGRGRRYVIAADRDAPARLRDRAALVHHDPDLTQLPDGSSGLYFFEGTRRPFLVKTVIVDGPLGRGQLSGRRRHRDGGGLAPHR